MTTELLSPYGARCRIGPAVTTLIPAHPDDVLEDRRLSIDEKRELLASWASDARAVEGCPAFRRLDNGEHVEVDTILAAMKTLDVERERSLICEANVSKTVRNSGTKRWQLRSSDNPDDDPQPPGIGAAALPRRYTVTVVRAEQALRPAA